MHGHRFEVKDRFQLHFEVSLLNVVFQAQLYYKFKKMNKNSETSSQEQSNNSYYFGTPESHSTLETSPVSQIRRLQENILNLYSLAKKEIGTMYTSVCSEINFLKRFALNSKNNSPEFLDSIIEVKTRSEQMINSLPEHLHNILVGPEMFQFFNRGRLNSLHTRFSKKLGSSKSLSKRKIRTLTFKHSSHQKSETALSAPRSETRIMQMRMMKTVKNLDFFQGTWSELQQVNLNNKNIAQLNSLMNVDAPNLKKLELSQNRLSNLDSFKGMYFPQLIHINLSHNKIRNLAGFPQANLPALSQLNLSNNLISSIDPLQESSFPGLKQLNIAGNRLKSINCLEHCSFPCLEIINIDNNEAISLETLAQCNFPSLKVLSFANNHIMSLQFLENSNLNFRSLRALIGNNNSIKHLEPLAVAKLPNITDIILHDNKISDISCLTRTDFPKLKELELQNNHLKVEEYGCFLRQNKVHKQLKRKYPFVLL